MSILVEKLEQRLQKLQKSMKNSNDSEHYAHLCSRESGFLTAFSIVKKHSDWIDISVEPIKRTEFDSEAVLAIDVNGYTYNVTLADVVISGETKREWTECKANWNGEFWEAVEYICQSEKLVAYKHIPSPPSEVKP